MWTLIWGGIIGAIAGWLTSKDIPGGIIGNIVAGLLGSWIGEKLLPTFGPVWGGIAIIPSIIGAVILIAAVSFILQRRK